MCHSLFSWISLPSMSTSRYVKTNWGYHRAGTNWDGNTVLSSVNREGLNNLHRPFICRKKLFYYYYYYFIESFLKDRHPCRQQMERDFEYLHKYKQSQDSGKRHSKHFTDWNWNGCNSWCWYCVCFGWSHCCSVFLIHSLSLF